MQLKTVKEEMMLLKSEIEQLRGELNDVLKEKNVELKTVQEEMVLLKSEM